MKAKRTRTLVIALCVLLLLLVPVGAAVVSGDMPYLRIGQQDDPSAWLTYDEVQELDLKLRREDLLKYVDRLKKETPDESMTADEAARITRKNELIQEYRDYVDRNIKKGLTAEEFQTHYEYLWDFYSDSISPLEPPPTPEEQLYHQMNGYIGDLHQLLTFHNNFLYHDKDYVDEVYCTDVPLMNEAIADLTALCDGLKNGTISFDQARRQYHVCIEEKIKNCAPSCYKDIQQRAEKDGWFR